MTQLPRWVLASGNKGKLREFEALLSDTGIELVPQGDLGVSSAEETGSTFVENAILKARHAARETGLPALADDSGLSVEALGGMPGIHSARYAGTSASSEMNVAKLLDALSDVPDEARGARFYCVIVSMRDGNDPAPLIAQAQWQGIITREPSGQGGFGYDPVFLDPTLNTTAAQLDAKTKNRISHRGRAIEQLRLMLAGEWQPR